MKKLIALLLSLSLLLSLCAAATAETTDAAEAEEKVAEVLTSTETEGAEEAADTTATEETAATEETIHPFEMYVSYLAQDDVLGDPAGFMAAEEANYVGMNMMILYLYDDAPYDMIFTGIVEGGAEYVAIWDNLTDVQKLQCAYMVAGTWDTYITPSGEDFGVYLCYSTEESDIIALENAEAAASFVSYVDELFAEDSTTESAQ